MKAITLQIGSTDDKLTQKEWCAFHAAMNTAVTYFAKRLHFSGLSPSDQPKQNACWVFEIDEDEELRAAVTRIRHDYRQDSAAWCAGETEFI